MVRRQIFIRVGHLNARLVGRGFKPIHPHDWITYVEEAPVGKLKKRKQLQFLKEENLLDELRPKD